VKQLKIFNGPRYIAGLYFESKKEEKDHIWYIFKNEYIFCLWLDSRLTTEEVNEPNLLAAS
jgi:hypothetical protein